MLLDSKWTGEKPGKVTLKWNSVIRILKNNWHAKKITFMTSLHQQKGQASFQSSPTCKVFPIKAKPTIERLHQLTTSFAFLSPCSSEAGSKSTGSQTTVTGHCCHHRVQTKTHHYTANKHCHSQPPARAAPAYRNIPTFMHTQCNTCIQLSLRDNIPKGQKNFGNRH